MITAVLADKSIKARDAGFQKTCKQLFPGIPDDIAWEYGIQLLDAVVPAIVVGGKADLFITGLADMLGDTDGWAAWVAPFLYGDGEKIKPAICKVADHFPYKDLGRVSRADKMKLIQNLIKLVEKVAPGGGHAYLGQFYAALLVPDSDLQE